MIGTEKVLVVVVSLILLAVGVFAFFTLSYSLGQVSQPVTTVTVSADVTDPSVAQTITIPSGAVVARVYETLNTGATQNIDPSNYTVVGTTVTINVTG